MAENKKSFILYADLITVIKKLVERDRVQKTNHSGELFLLILEYVNDLNPVPIDFIVEMAFEPIKLQLKRDLKKFEVSIDEKKRAGRIGNLKRWHPDLYVDFHGGKKTLEEVEQIAESRKASQSDKVPSQKVAKIAVTDNVTDNVTVTDNVIKKDINSRKTSFASLLKPFSEKYSKEILNEFYLYWTEHGVNDKKMRFEKEKSFSAERRLATWAKRNAEWSKKSFNFPQDNEPKPLSRNSSALDEIKKRNS